MDLITTAMSGLERPEGLDMGLIILEKVYYVTAKSQN